jgi:hypothetical protein
MRADGTARWIAVAAVGAAWIAIAPAACFFPDYTFDLTTSSGGSGGTGTTISTTSSSSTTTSSSTGTGGELHVFEDCQNGVDDNDDGKIDCEDPDCQAYECVDPIPAGWETPGYVALYEGFASQTPPDCPTDMPTEVYEGNATLNAQPALCSPCGCAAPTGQDCQLLTDLDTATKPGIQAMQVSNQPCGQTATQINTLTVPNPWGGACYHDESFPGGQSCLGAPCNQSVNSAAPTVTGGTCMATGGSPTKPPVQWSSRALACHGSRQGGGCPSPQVCLPKPASPFKSRVCIEKTGDVECPAGTPFTKKGVYYGDVDDTRDCSGCACGSPSGGSCEITVTLYSDPTAGACVTPVGSFKAGQCFDLVGNPAVRGRTDQITKAPSGATCQPSQQSMPFGSVTPKDATTFCCL